jgi:archaellum component FlaC
VVLDLRHLEGSLHVGRKTIHDIGRELEEIRKEINRIGTGFHKPSVITQDIKEKRAEDEEIMRRLEEQTRKSDTGKPPSAGEHAGRV